MTAHYFMEVDGVSELEPLCLLLSVGELGEQPPDPGPGSLCSV